MRKKFIHRVFSRTTIVATLILLQIAVLTFAIWQLSSYFVYVYAAFEVLSLVVVVWMVGHKDNPSYKLAWTIPILLFPVFGGLFYLLFGGKKATGTFRRRMERAFISWAPSLVQDDRVMKEISAIDRSAANQARYLAACSTYPLHKNTMTRYLSPGEVKFEALCEELEKAEHYIFLEYFIIGEGVMWGRVLDILRRKAAQGVDVRVMYDDVGCSHTLPSGYHLVLRKMGIKCMVFNPFRPVMSLMLNNRDHRKIAVIDGHTGFTGGINLADEYINEYERFGRWKDAAIMLKGEAVWNLTIMFLQVWNFMSGVEENYSRFMPHVHHPEPFESDGFVLPYGDSPLDEENVGESAYLNIIGRAKDYIYINTPYLIVDNELVTALCLAAKSGVDVRIVTPAIPDKWFVHMVTQAYYQQLVEAGVKIYEFVPGFIHSKTFVADDEIGVVGTINLDYRSLYLHFECAVWLYRTRSVMEIKEDFLETLTLCRQISLEDCTNIGFFKRILRGVLRAFAPLM